MGFRPWWALVALALGAPWGVGWAGSINNVRISSGPEATRVVLDLSTPAEHRVFTLDDPDRLVIDLPRTSMAAPSTALEPKGLIAGFRTGERPGGELRLVLDLKRAVKAKSFLLPPNEQFGHRLVIDLEPTGTEAAVRRAAAPAAERGRDLVVAIDAGHGGEDPGAIGPKGTREKEVVLAIARLLAADIDREPGMRALLIRNGDYLVSHRKRMEIAHHAQADFFISIHADSYKSQHMQGATVYVLSEKGATDEAALLVAKRENASDLIGGVSLADKDQLLARVLVDLSQGATLSASSAAGDRVIKRLSAVTPLRKAQVQRAPFLVLKSPDIPSLLIETGYISNPNEEAKLRDPNHQAELTAALRAGIVDYFADNPPPGSYFALNTIERARDPVRHVISRGETLSGIAQRYRVSPSSIKRSNSLRSDVIRVGQVLVIPPG